MRFLTGQAKEYAEKPSLEQVTADFNVAKVQFEWIKHASRQSVVGMTVLGPNALSPDKTLEALFG